MICTTCKTAHPAESYLTRLGKKTKNCTGCRDKNSAKFRKHYAGNAEQVRARVKGWRKANPAAWAKVNRICKRRYDKNNPEAKKRKNRRYTQRYPEKNAARVGAYKARKLRATPGWASLDAIRKIYALARQHKALTGELVHIDHMVPLKSDLVCGLHCEANLRIVIGTFNARKKNLTWPDMW